MNEIAVRQATLPEQVEFSKTLAASKLLPPDYRGNPANVLYALQYAHALGIEPIHALTSIHVISGRPAASADLIAALVRRAGHRLRITSTDTEATATIIRADDTDFAYTATWDMEKAKTAGLLSNPSWNKYPAAMLRSRAITEVARQGASDALFGVVYTPEELGVDVDALGAPTGTTSVSTGRVTAADILAPESESEVVDAEPEPEYITGPQSKKLHALLRDIGCTTREQGLAYLTDVLGREVDTTKTLTKTEASTAIDSMEQA